MQLFLIAVTLCNAARLTRTVTLKQDSGLEVHSNSMKLEEKVPKLEPMTNVPVQHLALDEAVQKATKLPSEIRAMLHAKHTQELMKAQAQSNEKKLTVLRGGKKQNPTDDPSGYPTLDKVREVLNQLYEETNNEADITLVQCSSFEVQTKAQIEQNTQVRVQLATEIATAREDIASANAAIQQAEQQITLLGEELHRHEHQCQMGRNELEELIKITDADYTVAKEINAKVDCAASTVGSAFLQCYMQNDNSHFKLRYSNGTMAPIQSKAALAAVQRAAQMVHAIAKKTDPPPKDQEAQDGAPTEEELDDQEKTTEWMESITLEGLPQKCGPPGDKVDVGEKCFVLKDAIEQMVGEIHYVLLETRERLTDLNNHCKAVSENLNGQLSEWSASLDQNQIMLTKATGTLNMATDELRLRVEEFKEAKTTLIDTINECNAKFKKFHQEKCGLSTIRLELYKIVGGNPYIVDCEVGEFVEQECSASCGGGTQMKTRDIVQEAVYGAACPPLTETVSCAEDACPVDCAEEDWSGWSACSKDCGGGVESRVRGIEVQPEHGGMPCGSVQETRSCNNHACDKDCELHEWTEWSGCNRGCGGGFQTRAKWIKEDAVGDGACAAEHEENPEADGGGARSERRDCNMHRCYPNLKCKAKQDLVLVLDASGSIGTQGFEATKKFSKDLVKRVNLNDEDGEKVGIVKFSHEATIESAMSSDLAGLESALDAMTFPQSVTMTGQGIDTALNIAQQGGRSDAETILFVVTDGIPSNKEAAEAAAKRAREQDLTRLVFVGVGNALDEDFMERMATYPHQSNFMKVNNFHELEEKMGALMAGFCPLLECSEEFTGDGADYRGCQSITRSGAECQNWEDWHPHYHWYRSWNEQLPTYPDTGLGNHNFCRNPDNDAGGMWCWTKDQTVGWSYCDPRDTNDVPAPPLEV